jgi:hypothetical protein
MTDKYVPPFLLISIAVIAAALLAPRLYARWQRSQADPDATTLRQLQQAGSDLTKPHEPEFFLYVPTEAGARKIAETLTAEGFKTDVHHTQSGKDWLCKGTKRMVLTKDALTKLRQQFIGLLKPFGGDYDGWGAEVVK